MPTDPLRNSASRSMLAAIQNDLGAALKKLGERRVGSRGSWRQAAPGAQRFRSAQAGLVRAWAVRVVAVVIFADRKDDVVVEETALRQLATAWEVAHSGGQGELSI